MSDLCKGIYFINLSVVGKSYYRKIINVKQKKRATLSLGTISLFKEKKKKAVTYSPTLGAVPSALKDLTTLFGMVKGVTPPLIPPTNL